EYLSLNERLDAAEKKKRDDEPKERWREEKAKASWSGQLSLAAGRVSRSVESFRRWLQLREPENGLSLLTGAQFQRLKLAFIVRRPEAFKRQFLFWAAVVIAAFYLSHFVWRMTGFKGDQTILPIVHLLCGIGLMMMVSLRDPLRDLLEFAEFAIGVLLGIAAMLACSVLCARPWWVVRRPLMQILGERISLRTSLWLLFSAATLAVILFFFGVGPRGSDAKVNLWIFQPAEAIKILVVFSLATYLAANWEYLRGLQHRGDGIFRLLRYFKAPRLVLFLPVVGAMAAMLALFAAIRDLGPALVLAVTFHSLYAIARKRYGLAACGFVVFVAGVYALYRLEWFETLNKRVDILRNVWENGLAGGDQIAHSLWAFASGGMTGMGLGLGDPDVIPAGYTDLIISAVGEELGFAGVVAVMALYAMLIAKAIRISLRAATDYEFFLALGLTLLTAFQILLITAGILAIFPLSGVVSPFLSYGKASMIANFAIFGLILGISTRRRKEEIPSPFAAPARRVSLAIGLVMLLVAGKAAWAQVFDSERIILRGVLTQLGEMKGKEIGDYDFSYNPRLIGPAEKLKRGTIFDRNGTPLASSDCEEMKKLSHRYKDFSIDIAEICKSRKRRYYPFGAKLFYLVGDPELGGNFGANYIERDYRARLHGYDDHSCLIERRVKKTRMEIEDEEFDAAERSGAWPVEPGGGTGAATPNAGAEEFAIEDELPEPHDAVDGQTRNVQPNATDRSGQTRTVKVIQRDLTELLPLLYYRYRPDHDRMRELVKRDRDLYLTIDAGLQLEAARRIEAAARNTAEKGAAAVVIDVSSGDVLASVSYPWPV
ncbi:MAG: FtsW/RodA/SpoVE family cell cycle protein, partial [Blastocatellia bacterium]